MYKLDITKHCFPSHRGLVLIQNEKGIGEIQMRNTVEIQPYLLMFIKESGTDKIAENKKDENGKHIFYYEFETEEERNECEEFLNKIETYVKSLMPSYYDDRMNEFYDELRQGVDIKETN